MSAGSLFAQAPRYYAVRLFDSARDLRMQCPSCAFDNPDHVRYCGSCGSALPTRCVECTFVSPPGFRFCGQCGTALTRTPKPAVVVPAEAHERARPDEAERRQITVLFCDLVGSTELSQRLDPEELRDLISAFRRVCADMIGRYDGYIARYVGDAILAYFGFPVAHEDDARRAVAASLAILSGLGQANAARRSTDGVELAARIGIHTGVVVAGDMGTGSTHEKMAIIGETPNLAARLQSMAEPNQILIGPVTYRLVERFFTCRPLGERAIKGIARPVPVHRVVGESSRERLAIDDGLPSTKFVNRRQELATLRDRLQRTSEGEGQVILLSGEAGIGKSRLLQRLREALSVEQHTWLNCACTPFGQNSALDPVIQLLRQQFHLGAEASPDIEFDKLEKAMGPISDAVPEAVAALAQLLSIPLPEQHPVPNLSPQALKQKTLDTILAWLLAQAEAHPLILVIEDLHWVDASTLELIEAINAHAAAVKLMVILTFRPDFTPAWSGASHITSIQVGRLPRADVGDMIDSVTMGKALPRDILDQIARKTDGIPLFVEELTKTVIESGLLTDRDSHYEMSGIPSPFTIPATLRDSLTARLDGLSGAKLVAQVGAAIGRVFSYDMVHAVAGMEEADLRVHLSQLARSEILLQRGLPPRSTYTFRHSLIQDAAYDSLLISRRQHYHLRIARAYPTSEADIAETRPELIAHHLTAAGQNDEAVDYWLKAGLRAMARSAALEAIAHFTKALGLLATLPGGPARTEREVGLLIELGSALMAGKGYAAPEVEKAFARAGELCATLGETSKMFPALWGLGSYYVVRGPLDLGRQLSEQLLRLAERVADPDQLLEAHRRLGLCLFLQGEMSAARQHLDQAITRAQQREARGVGLFGTDPDVLSLANHAWLMWFLGYPDAALDEGRRSVELAEQIGRPYSRVYALGLLASIHQLRGEADEAGQFANMVVQLSTEQEFAYWLAWGRIVGGWAIAAQGLPMAGIEQMRDGLDAYLATGADQMRPYALTLLAASCGQDGQTGDALAFLDEVEAGLPGRARYYDAEMHRLRGELVLARVGDAERAREFFLQALATARQQGARSLELRAALSLARLEAERGDTRQARRALEPVFAKFSEGFTTTDLREAQMFLNTL